MSDAERTIDTVAILGWDLLQVRVHSWCQIVTRLAEEVSTETGEDSDRAAVLAFPIDLNFTVLGTGSLTSTDGFQSAVSAAKVLFLTEVCLSFLGSFLFAVDQATEVRLLALEALVEGATVHGVVQMLLEVEIGGVIDTAVSEDTLKFAVLKRLSLYLILEDNLRAEDICDEFSVEGIDWS